MLQLILVLWWNKSNKLHVRGIVLWLSFILHSGVVRRAKRPSKFQKEIFDQSTHQTHGLHKDYSYMQCWYFYICRRISSSPRISYIKLVFLPLVHRSMPWNVQLSIQTSTVTVLIVLFNQQIHHHPICSIDFKCG